MAVARKCKCYYCGEIFDRNKEPWVMVTANRYAHKDCQELYGMRLAPNEKDYNELIDYVEKLFGLDNVPAKITKQIKDFKANYGYTYSGMLKTLKYWFEVRGAEKERGYGIGIIPYIYEDAFNYYKTLFEAEFAARDIKDYKAKVIEITIAPPEREARQPRLFNIEEEN
jgi:hypothetical protein